MDTASVLLVDDIPANLLALEGILEPLGHHLVRAGSGEEALRQVLQHDFAAILMDVRMPGMDGVETAERVHAREKSRSTPILFLTANPSDREEVLRGYAAGGGDYLFKPLDSDVLRAKVSVFVDLYQERQAALAREEQAKASVKAGALEHNKRMAEDEADFRDLFESAMMGMAITNDRGHLLDANDTLLRMLGHTRDNLEAGHLRWDALTSAEGAAANALAVEELRTRGVARPFEKEYLRADGTRLPVLVGAIRARTPGRNITFVLDISARKAAEVERIELLRQAQEALHLREQFLTVASHELKTPLTSLWLRLQLLKETVEASVRETTPVAPESLRRVTAAELQVRRLSRLVEGLFEASRLTGNGGVPLSPERVDLDEVLRVSMSTMELECSAAGCELVLDQVDAAVAELDPLRVEQILVSLISNAVKFGAGRPIHLGLRAEQGHARFHVRDEGFGLSAEDAVRIFERFGRAVSERNYGGLGLGLWVSRQVAESMGGSLTVQSTPGQGATFVLDLPLGSGA